MQTAPLKRGAAEGVALVTEELMDGKTGYGIIGCGGIGRVHARAVSNTPDVELIAVSDIVHEKADKLAHEFGARCAYAEYRDLLARDDIQIVSICTPSGTHADVGIDAARAGKHVLTEKPIDITLPKVDRLIDVCNEQNVRLACILQRRTLDVWQLVKRTIDVGKLGRMVLASAYLKYCRSQDYYDSGGGWRGTWALDGGGALMIQGIHMVDILQWIMGPVDLVLGFAEHLVRDIEVEDTAVASIRFRSGALGTVEAATSVVPGMEHRMEFHGEHGTIRVEGENIVEWHVPGEDLATAIAQVECAEDRMSPDPEGISPRGHQIQIADLVSAVREDREPMVTGAEARKAVELILAIYESARTGVGVAPGASFARGVQAT